MDTLHSLWIWLWDTVAWASQWTVFAVFGFALGILSAFTSTEKRVRSFLLVGSFVCLAIAFFHSWLVEHRKAVREYAELQDYFNRVNTAVTISQSWVYPGQQPVFWTPCRFGDKRTLCFPGIVLLLRIRNVHDYPVMPERVTRPSFIYVGAKYNLPFDLNWTLYYADNPSQGLRQVNNTLRNTGMIQPHSYTDCIVSFSSPFKTTIQPDSISFNIVDTAETSLPVKWTQANPADISYSMVHIPMVDLSKAVIKFKPEAPYAQFINYGGL